MTDAREMLADLLKRSPQMYRPASMRLADVDAILSALHLTPAAASALMEERATVVPVEPTMKQVRAAGLSAREYMMETGGNSVNVIYSAALAASPYREKEDAGV